MSRRAVGRHYEISASAAVKWLERVERHGSREPVGPGGHRASKLMAHREFLEAARAENLNPIEQVFARFKTLLRKAGARTYDAICDACGEILAQYPPAECAAYFKNAGYA